MYVAEYMAEAVRVVLDGFIGDPVLRNALLGQRVRAIVAAEVLPCDGPVDDVHGGGGRGGPGPT